MQGWSGSVRPTIEKPRWLNYDETLTISGLRTLMDDAGASLLSAAKASHGAGVLDQDRRINHVFHLITHGTHHRGQLLSMATLLGYPQPFEGGDFGGWSGTAGMGI